LAHKWNEERNIPATVQYKTKLNGLQNSVAAWGFKKVKGAKNETTKPEIVHSSFFFKSA
jgi:hypothetical protein